MIDYPFQKSATFTHYSPLWRVRNGTLIQINPNLVVKYPINDQPFYELPDAFFSTKAKPERGNSFTLRVLPLLTKSDRRKDARVVS